MSYLWRPDFWGGRWIFFLIHTPLAYCFLVRFCVTFAVDWRLLNYFGHTDLWLISMVFVCSGYESVTSEVQESCCTWPCSFRTRTQQQQESYGKPVCVPKYHIMKAYSSDSTWIRLVSGGRPVYRPLLMGRLVGLDLAVNSVKVKSTL
jgi:hypothetical protein